MFFSTHEGFGRSGNDLVQGSSYKITYLTINVFNNERIKTTERTEVTLIEDENPITCKCSTITKITG